MTDIDGSNQPGTAHFTVTSGGEIDAVEPALDTAADGEELEGTTGGLA